MIKKFPLLFVVLLLALFLRIYQLDKIPPELFGDEIDAGYQAYSILHTGKDYYGNSWPIMFHSFTEYRLPLFIYSMVPTVAMLGLNEWGVRLTGLFWGMSGIIGLFLLSKEMFNQKIGLLAAFLLAISPWHLQFSRQSGIETLMLLTVLTLAFWAYLKGWQNFRMLILSVILFSLTVYIYATGSVFLVLFGLFLLISDRRKIKSLGFHKIIILTVVGSVILLPYINLYRTGKSGERFSSISIAADDTLVDSINQRRTEENSPNAALFHNKLMTYFYEGSGNYLSSLSFDFLFFKGDSNLRHSVGGNGELYLFEILLIFSGILWVIKNPSSFTRYLIIWLLVAPIPSSLTRDGGNHASRLIIMLLPLIILAATGLEYIWIERRRFLCQILLIIILFLSIVNISFYFHRYYVEWPKDSWRFWQIGYKESFNYIKSVEGNYSRIYFNNTYEPSLSRFLFWYQYDPKVFQNRFIDDKPQKNIVNGFDGFQIGSKYFFGSLANKDTYQGLDNLLKPGELYFVSAREEAGLGADWRKNPPPTFKVLKTVINPFDQPIFYIVTRI